jgi:soluble lytic murein transglycosylase-like protein
MAFLYLYYGNWDIAGLIGINLSVGDAVSLGRQIGPNAKSIKTCKAALKTARKNMNGVQRADSSWDALSAAGENDDIPPELLGAIGIRESNFTANAVQQDGHGRGAFQIDCCGDIGNKPPAHPGVSQQQAFDVNFAANFAADLLSSSMNRWSNFGNIAGPAAIRDYNAGSRYTATKSLLGIPALYRGTTQNNYVSNTINLMDCFQ